jgi:uncharacterized membrane protein
MEQFVQDIAIAVSRAAETVAATVIGFAVLKLVWQYIRMRKQDVRINFGSSVAVALELMLGADVLATAIAPSWDDIGKLASIAVIRTGLNYFLAKELKESK